MKNLTSNLQIPGSDALKVSHRDYDKLGHYYIHMWHQLRIFTEVPKSDYHSSKREKDFLADIVLEIYFR